MVYNNNYCKMGALLILSQLNPLENVQVSQITGIEKVGNTIKIFYVKDDGGKDIKTHMSTDFLMQQINGYGLQVYGIQ